MSETDHAWYREQWRRLSEGEVCGVVRPLDDRIRELRGAGMSLDAISKNIGKARSYVQNRLLRIAAREQVTEEGAYNE